MMNKLTTALIKQLQQQKLTLAMAESITCGLAAHRLSTVKGISDVFAGSLVCYSAEVKHKLLGISEKKIAAYTCESQEVTDAMARNLRRLMKANVYAALTGLASAGGSETKIKPVGTVFFSVFYKNKMYNLRHVFRGSPLEIRNKACLTLYQLILSTIEP